MSESPRTDARQAVQQMFEATRCQFYRQHLYLLCSKKLEVFRRGTIFALNY